MNAIFATLMIIAMIAVFGSLAVGVFGMARGGEFNKKYGNKLMRMRVILQGAAILLFVIAAASYNK